MWLSITYFTCTYIHICVYMYVCFSHTHTLEFAKLFPIYWVELHNSLRHTRQRFISPFINEEIEAEWNHLPKFTTNQGNGWGSQIPMYIDAAYSNYLGIILLSFSWIPGTAHGIKLHFLANWKPFKMPLLFLRSNLRLKLRTVHTLGKCCVPQLH